MRNGIWRGSGFSLFVLVGIFCLSRSDLYGQASVDILIPKTQVQDASDTIVVCADPNELGITFDASNYRSGNSFWANLDNGDLVVDSVPYNVYSDPTKFLSRAKAKIPLDVSVKKIERKLRTDFKEYRFRLVQIFSPTNFEKEIVFRNYPKLPSNKNIHDYILLSPPGGTIDTLEACISKGVAIFTIPSNKISTTDTFDSRIRWTLESGRMESEVLSPVFSPSDVRNVSYSLVNIPSLRLQGKLDNEALYRVRLQLERPLPNGKNPFSGGCIETGESKTVMLRVVEVAQKPVLATGDTLWYCADLPFDVPIQVDDNYPKQFKPVWYFDPANTNNSPGFNGDPNFPYVSDPNAAGTYLTGVDKPTNPKLFSTYHLSVLLRSDKLKCQSESKDLVVKVGHVAAKAKIYGPDVLYSCANASLSGVQFDNIGTTAGKAGAVVWKKISGPSSYSISTTVLPQTSDTIGVLRIDNLSVPTNAGDVNKYVFLLQTQNEGCPVNNSQKDTLIVNVVSHIAVPKVIGATLNGNQQHVTTYLSSLQDIYPLQLLPQPPFQFTWYLPKPLRQRKSSSVPSTFLLDSFTIPVAGSVQSHPIKIVAGYEGSQCTSDTAHVVINVKRGFSLFVRQVVAPDNVLNNDEQLDTVAICTNGNNLRLHIKKGSPNTITVKVKSVSHTGGFKNFQFTTRSNTANKSDTMIGISYGVLDKGKPYQIIVDYSLFDGPNEVVNKKFVVNMSGISTLNPIPDADEIVNLCAEYSTKLNAQTTDNGFWTQIKGERLTIADNKNPRAIISGLLRPSKQNDVADYAFQWTTVTGFCPPIVDTQYIFNLPRISVPYITALRRLDDARTSTIYTRSGSSDTICLSSSPTSDSAFYVLTSNPIAVGKGKWRFAVEQSVNATNVSLSDVFSDSLVVAVPYPKRSKNRDSAVYVFERIVYHDMRPVGCDTLRSKAYIIFEKNTNTPRLISGEQLVKVCGDKNQVILYADSLAKTVRWRIVPDFVKDRVGSVAGNSIELSPEESESLRPTFVGFQYHATRNGQTRLRTDQKDSFSVDVEMQHIGNYCRFRKDTIQLRFYNKPSPAAFKSDEPLRFCGSSNSTADSIAIIDTLKKMRVIPIVGDYHFTRTSSVPIRGARVDSQVWLYSVFHGGCDTNRTSKIVYVQKGVVDVAKTATDSLFVCYSNRGSLTTSFEVLAKSILPSSYGTWKLLSTGQESPLFSDYHDTVVTLSGLSLENNVNNSPLKTAIYTLEWNVVDACSNISKDTCFVFHYGAPPLTRFLATTDTLYSCSESTQQKSINIKTPLVTGGTKFVYDIRFTPDVLNRTGTPTAGATMKVDTIANGRNVGTATKPLVFTQPSVAQINDTVAKFSFGVYDGYRSIYSIQYQVQNGTSCPRINVGAPISLHALDMEPMATFDYSGGYVPAFGGALISCNGGTPFPVKLKNTGSNDDITTLTSYGFHIADNRYYLDESITVTAGIAQVTVDMPTPSPSSNFNTHQYPINLELARYSSFIPNAAVASTSDGCLNTLYLSQYVFSNPAQQTSFNNDKSLGSVTTKTIRICKGANLNDSIIINNPKATQFVLLRRSYNRVAGFWHPWTRIDSAIGFIRGFRISDMSDDSLQYRVEARFQDIDKGPGCSGAFFAPYQELPGMITVSGYEKYGTNVAGSTVGNLTVNGQNKTIDSVCSNTAFNFKVAVNNYKNKSVSLNTSTTSKSVLRWQRGVGSSEIGEIVWKNIANTEGSDFFEFNGTLTTPTYFRAVYETTDGCYATSPLYTIDIKTANSCPTRYTKPGIRDAILPASKRVQFYGSTQNCVITGFNYATPFSWNMNKPFSSTGVPVSGSGYQNKIVFNTVVNNTQNVFTDTLNIVGDKSSTRPEDKLTVYVDVLPVPRLHYTGLNYTKVSYGGRLVGITELNPHVKYTWQQKSNRPSVTGIASEGSGKGAFYFRTPRTNATLRDTVIFIKNDSALALYNNYLDTVIYFIEITPEGKLATSLSTTQLTEVVTPSTRVVLSAFLPGKQFNWETSIARRAKSGAVPTGNSITGIPHTGTKASDSVEFTSADNNTDTVLNDTVYFVSDTTGIVGYAFSSRDTVVYYISVVPQTRLHSNSQRYITKFINVLDSFSIDPYVNNGVPFSWQVLSATAGKTITYKKSLSDASRSTNSSDNGIDRIIYYAPSDVPSVPFDTIRFTRDVNASVNANNNKQDTMDLVVGIYEPFHLNTKADLTKKDTVVIRVLEGEPFSVSSPVVTSSVQYKWELRNANTKTAKSGITAAGTTSTSGTSFGGTTKLLASGMDAVADTFALYRVGRYATYNNFRDTVCLIVVVLHDAHLVNKEHPSVLFNSKGYYTQKVHFPFANSWIDKDVLPYIHPDVSYNVSRVQIRNNVVSSKTGTSEFKINGSNSIPTKASFNKQLSIRMDVNTADSTIFDTILLTKNARVGVLEDEDSLVIFLSAAPRTRLRKTHTPKYLVYDLDYNAKRLNINTSHINSRIKFGFHRWPSSSTPITTLSATSVFALENPAADFTDSVIFNIELNQTDVLRRDTFLLLTLGSNIANNAQDTLFVVINQNPVTRLRSIGYSETVYKDYYSPNAHPSSSPAIAAPFVLRSELVPGVRFSATKSIGAAATTIGNTTVDSLSIMPVYRAGELDTITLERTSDASVPLNARDRIKVVLRYNALKRLRRSMFNQMDTINIVNVSTTSSSFFIGHQLDPTVPYRGEVVPGSGTAVSSFSPDGGLRYISVAAAFNHQGRIQFKSPLNREGRVITQQIRFTRSADISNNNAQDTFIVTVNLLPLPCAPILSKLDSVILEVRSGEPLTTYPWYSNPTPVTIQVNEGRPSNVLASTTASRTAPLQTKPNNTNGVLFDTLKVFPDATLNLISSCPTDTVITFLKSYPSTAACTEGLTGGTVRTQYVFKEFKSSPTTDTIRFELGGSNLAIKIGRVGTNRNVVSNFSFYDAATRVYSVDLVNNTFQNVYDTVDVYRDIPSSRLCGTQLASDSVRVIFVSPPTTHRLRPAGTSPLVTFNVQEEEKVRIDTDIHINKGVDYTYQTLDFKDVGLGTNTASQKDKLEFTAINSDTPIRGTVQLVRNNTNPNQTSNSFDTLLADVRVNPFDRLTTSTAKVVDTLVREVDFSAQQIVIRDPQVRPGLPFGNGTFILNEAIRAPLLIPNILFISDLGKPLGANPMPKFTTTGWSNTTYVQDEFSINLEANNSDTLKEVIFSLGVLVPRTKLAYKDSIRIIVRQAPRPFLRKSASTARYEYVYLDAAFDSVVLIKNSINQGIPFNYSFKSGGANFANVGGLRSGTGKDSLELSILRPNRSTVAYDTLQLVSTSALADFKDTLTVILQQNPIVRLRSLGYDRRQFAPDTVSWSVNDILLGSGPITPNIGYVYSYFTPRPNAIITNPIGEGVNNIIVSSPPNSSNTELVDSALLVRKAPAATLNHEDSITLIVVKPPLQRLRKNTTSRVIELNFNGGEREAIGSQYINTDKFFSYNSTNQGVIDQASTKLNASRIIGSFALQISFNATSQIVRDTIRIVRDDIPANLTAEDTLDIILSLNPLKRLRPITSTQFVELEEAVPADRKEVYKQSHITPGVEFFHPRLRFPIYQDSAVVTLKLNTTNTNMVTIDSFAKRTNTAAPNNSFDSLYIKTTSKPLPRLRKAGIPKRINIALYSLDSLTIGAQFINQGIDFDFTHSSKNAKPPVRYNQDSLKIYAAVNKSAREISDSLIMVRNGSNLNEQDSLIINIKVRKAYGLHINNALSDSISLYTNDTILLDVFNTAANYRYKSKRFSNLDNERVVDFNHTFVGTGAARGVYTAIMDTSLSHPLRDTILFWLTDAAGTPIHRLGNNLASSVDSFSLYVTLLPLHLTYGQRFATQSYRSGKPAQVYKKYLNEDIEFLSRNENVNPSFAKTGIPTGTGKDFVEFTTTINASRYPITDTIRFVKKYGKVKVFQDTLLTEISVQPVTRLWDKPSINYYLHSNRNTSLDSFFLNVPFTWKGQGTSGLATSGSGCSFVHFKTITNYDTTAIVDTVTFIKQPDGEVSGSWDTLKVYIHVLPVRRLYDLARFPTQVAYIEVCSKSDVVFSEFLKNRNDSGYRVGATRLSALKIKASKDTLQFTSRPTTKLADELDTIRVVRKLVDSLDVIQKWDSLAIVVRTLQQPPSPTVTFVNTAMVCPGTKANIQLRSSVDDTVKFETVWMKDSMLFHRGISTPSIVLGVNDTARIFIITRSAICPKDISDTQVHIFTSYDLPKINVRWKDMTKPPHEPFVFATLITDTLSVEGQWSPATNDTTATIAIENKSLRPVTQPDNISYSWSASPSLAQVTNNRISSEFTFNAPALVAQLGQNKPYDIYRLNLRVTAQCFDSTFKPVLKVRIIPKLSFDAPDTLCLPNLLYPINRSVAYDTINYTWTIVGTGDTILGASPVIDFTPYITAADQEKSFTITLMAKSTYGRMLSFSKSIHVFNKMKPAIIFAPAVSYLDTICIGSANRDYFLSSLTAAAYIEKQTNKTFSWILNDSLMGNAEILNTSLSHISQAAKFTPEDSMRFVVNTNEYNCYSDTVSKVIFVKGIVHPTDKALIDTVYYNYCPPARVSFTSNLENAVHWEWYLRGKSRISGLRQSENVRETTRKQTGANLPGIVPFDTSYLNDYLIADTGITYFDLITKANFRLCPLDTASIGVKVYTHPALRPPNVSLSISAQGGVLCLPDDVTFHTVRYFTNGLDTSSKLVDFNWALNNEDFVSVKNDWSYSRFITKADASPDGSFFMNEFVIDEKGCRSQMVATPIKEQDKPVANFFYKDICLGDTFYAASSSFLLDPINNSTYVNWDMGDGTTYDNMNNIVHYFSKEGVYNVTLILGYTNPKCVADTFVAKITVYGPIDPKIVVPSAICINTPTEFKVLSDNSLDTILNYYWQFGNDPVYSSSAKDVTRSFSQSGLINVSFTGTSKYCNVQKTLTMPLLISQPLREPRTYDDIYVVKNQPFALYAEPNAKAYEWNHKLFLDNPIIHNPTAKVSENTKFEVRINFNECVITDFQNVYLTDQTAIQAPSAFTPNGDGINDEFRPIYMGIQRLNFFKIFDASGMEVFSTTSPFERWNGTMNGHTTLAPNGLYKWAVQYLDKDGNQQLKNGVVLLTN